LGRHEITARLLQVVQAPLLRKSGTTDPTKTSQLQRCQVWACRHLTIAAIPEGGETAPARSDGLASLKNQRQPALLKVCGRRLRIWTLESERLHSTLTGVADAVRI